MTGHFLCFGELLYRFTSPGHERLFQSDEMRIFCGGAEANVAVSLARFGHDATMVSAVADNPLGQNIIEKLAAQNVRTNEIVRASGRMGLYFLETGAVRRPSRIVYDRAGSVFAETPASAYDWNALLKGVEVLHISGITPAVGPKSSKAAIQAVKTAFRHGVKVSFDGNYREALWQAWNGDGPETLRDILSFTHTAFINERDIALILGQDFDSRADAIAHAFESFPNLQTIAATKRQLTSTSNQTLTGELYTRSGHWASRSHELDNVIDRIGGGDAFAAGVLHGQASGYDEQYTIEFAMAAGAIKHSIPGDWNLTNCDEVEDAIKENSLDVRR